MIAAVIDTNVLVSAFWSFGRNTPPMRILTALVNGAFALVASDGIFEEHSQVLRRKKFDFDSADVSRLLDFIANHARWVIPVESKETFPDLKDKVFYCTALALEKAKVVTGNTKHFPHSAIVVTAAEFCEILGI